MSLAMSLRPSLAVSIALASVASLASLLAVSTPAQADDCTGWFCDDEGKSAPAPKAGEPTTATVPDGDGGTDILSGKVVEVIPGVHIKLELANGEVKTIAWATLLQLQISGKIVIGGGSAAPAPKAAPPPAPPSVVIIAPMPPQKQLPPPPPSHVSPPPVDHMDDDGHEHRSFKERWALGFRLNFLQPGANSNLIKGTNNGLRDFVGTGTGLELNLGYRVSPAWTPYGFFEYARFKHGTINDGVDGNVTSAFTGLGIHANTNPDGPIGFLFDIAMGYRWLTVPYGPGQLSSLDGTPSTGGAQGPAGKVTYGGFQALRLGMGLSIVSSRHVRFDVQLQGTVGSFSRRTDSNGSCVGGGKECESIPEDKRGAHMFGGLSIGGMFDL